jgi:hypothetical protein
MRLAIVAGTVDCPGLMAVYIPAVCCCFFQSALDNLSRTARSNSVTYVATRIKTKAGGSSVEDSGVSLSKVKDLLNEQKLFDKQLLQQQENCFKCCAKILVESTNKRMDDLTRDVSGLG